MKKSLKHLKVIYLMIKIFGISWYVVYNIITLFLNILILIKCNNYIYCIKVLRLSSVGGKSIKCMVKRIMTLLFTPDLLCKFPYNGRGNKKRPFDKLVVKNVIFGKELKLHYCSFYF